MYFLKKRLFLDLQRIFWQTDRPIGDMHFFKESMCANKLAIFYDSVHEDGGSLLFDVSLAPIQHRTK
jgi:hypothetical protein